MVIGWKLKTLEVKTQEAAVSKKICSSEETKWYTHAHTDTHTHKVDWLTSCSILCIQTTSYNWTMSLMINDMTKLIVMKNFISIVIEYIQNTQTLFWTNMTNHQFD